MKTRKSFRILCALLSLLLVSQFAVTVFAATSSTWPGNGGTYYLETSLVRSSVAKSARAYSTTTIQHTQWYTTLMDGYYDMTTTEDWNALGYGDKVTEAAAKSGYDNDWEEYNMYLQDAIGGIPGEAVSGDYYVRADTQCREISYVVYWNDGSGYVEYEADTVYSPYNIYEDATGYAKKVN